MERDGATAPRDLSDWLGFLAVALLVLVAAMVEFASVAYYGVVAVVLFTRRLFVAAAVLAAFALALPASNVGLWK